MMTHKNNLYLSLMDGNAIEAKRSSGGSFVALVFHTINIDGAWTAMMELSPADACRLRDWLNENVE